MSGTATRCTCPRRMHRRLLFLSAFYRPEWVATAGEETLAIEQMAGAFIGVTVPPGVQDIDLAFRPRTRMALTWVSGLSLVALLVAFGTITWRGRASGLGPASENLKRSGNLAK